MSAAPFRIGDPLPPALLVGASARCLLDELLARCLLPARDAEIRRLPAAAFAKEKEMGGLAAVVLAELANASLFGAHRVVVVLQGHELLRDASIQSWIGRPAPRASLLLGSVRTAKDGLPAVPAKLTVATVWEPGPQGLAELRRFLERRAAARGATITPGALDALLEHAGPALDRLDAEIEKLALYRLGETIDAVHVDELCGHASGRDFDRLWQALRQGQGGEALGLLGAMAREGLLLFGGGRLFGHGQVAGALLPMLLTRIRRVVAVSAGQEKLVAAASEALGMKPGYVHFLQQDARALGPRLGRWQAAAVAAEIAQKRVGTWEDDELLERLVVELARVR